MYYSLTPTNYDISHHGILGQKWGKQNGPPYPIGSGDHSAAEKKAGWRKSVKKDKPVTSKNYRKKPTKAYSEAKIKDINKMSNEDLKKSNERLRLEQEHARLTGGIPNNRGVISRFGERIGNNLIQQYGDQVATTIATTVTIAAGKELVKKLLIAAATGV